MLEEIIRPMYTGEGYNPWNTLFIIAVFSLGAWIAMKLTRDEEWEFRNYKQYIPVITLFVFLRLTRDFGLTKSIFFITPWIWIAGAIAGYLVRGNRWLNFPIILSSSLLFGHYLKYLSIKPMSLLVVPAILFAWAASRWLRFIDFPSFAAQMFDATTTYLGLSAGLYEEHVVARAVTSALGPAGIFLLKIPLLILLYKMIEKDRKFFRFLIFLVGFGPGLRNLILYNA